MIDAVFLTIYIMTPFFLWILLRAAGERFSHVSLISIVTISIYIYSILGALPLYFGWDEYRVEIGIVDKTTVLLVLMCSALNAIFLLVGYLLYKLIISKRTLILSNDYHSLGSQKIIAIYATLGISVFFLALYISQLGQIALFVALNSDYSKAYEVRSLMGNDYGSNYHWYRILIYDVPQFCCYSLFAHYLKEKNIKSLIGFLIAFAVCAFSSVIAIEKGPLIWLIIGLYLTYIVVLKNGVIPFRVSVAVLLVLTSILLTMYLIFMGVDDLANAVESMASRIFTGQISPAYFYLEYYPSIKEYMLGQTMPNPGGLLPFKSISYTVELADWISPENSILGVVGSAPTVFWGESYANFGFYGIPFIAVLVGFGLGFVSSCLSFLKLNALTIGLLVWIILHFKDLSGTGFSSFLFDLTLFIIITIYSLIVCFDFKSKANCKI